MMGNLGHFMEQYIQCFIGINFITLFILLVRKFIGHKLSRRFIYGIWMMMPVFMITFPFIHAPASSVTNVFSGAINSIMREGTSEAKTDSAHTYIGAQGVTDISADPETGQQMHYTDKSNITEENLLKLQMTVDNTALNFEQGKTNLMILLFAGYVGVAIILFFNHIICKFSVYHFVQKKKILFI